MDTLEWQITTEGYGQSSPVIINDKVFITAIAGDMQETNVIQCLELKSGKVLWTHKFKSSQQIKTSRMVSKGAPTPVVDQDAVYAFYESGDLVAFTHDGKEIWKRSLSKDYGKIGGTHGLGSSPAQSKDAIIILVDQGGPGYLMSIDKKTGKNNWKIERQEHVSWSSPIVQYEKGIGRILISSTGSVSVHDLKTGKVIWEFNGFKRNTVGSPTVFKDLIYITSPEKDWNVAVKCGANDANAIAWRADISSSSFASPVIQDNRVFYVGRTGMISCLNADSGKIIWKHQLKASCWATPLVTQDKIYFFNKSGETTVLKADSNEAEILATNKLDIEGTLYGFAAIEEYIVIRSGTQLFCLRNSQ